VRLVGVAEHGGGGAGQGRGEDPVAEVGLGAAAGTEVVGGATDGDLDPSGPMRREELPSHPPPELPLLGVRVIRAVFGERASGRSPVHVDVLHADQPRAAGFGGGQHAGLQGGELLEPAPVGRVEGLIYDPGAPGDGGGELRIAGVAADHLDVVGHRGGAGAVDQPYRLAAPAKRVEGGQTDGAGSEDHVARCGVHAVSPIWVGARRSPAPLVVA